jgi:EmrB/QacA subfamily drug resistance transporter
VSGTAGAEMAGGTGPGTIRMGTPTARWVVTATVLGSGVAFLDSTVVNVALPAIGRNLHAGITGLQWTVDAYLITLTALILLGGSLGDIYGRRRVFVLGLAGFGLASTLCAVAPSIVFLIAARALQGVAGALLVPESLSIISASFDHADRARAIGAWSGLGGVAGAVGPFLGGWLVDTGSWRLVFLINIPITAVAIAVALRHVPETRDESAARHVDLPGAVAATIGLGAGCYAIIEGARHFGPTMMAVAVVGVVSLLGFVVIEQRQPQPMLPLWLFRSRQFTGANLTTLAVYAGLGATTFLVVLELQLGLGYSALAAGVTLFPLTLLMLLLSARFGALAQRTGARLPMTVGPMVVAVGLVLLSEVHPGSRYASVILPAAVVFGLGLAMTVAPLTAAVLGAVDDAHVGVASAVNNAVARLAGLLSVALLPALVRLRTDNPSVLTSGYRAAMLIAAALAALGGLIAFATIRRSATVLSATQPSIVQACNSPVLAAAAASASGEDATA